ncbi:MAG: ribosomal RNA small subunit methyltransferase A [Dehalococcoidia bacterium]|nr:ribosomal RNA small subunit methyltransferase A [Dehalococcoidia bacterium]
MYQQILRQHGLRPRKRLGQHFLIDEAVLERILSAAELRQGDVVVEVGPGLGVLTEALARQGARVIAVELDARLVAMLRKRLAPSTHVRVIHGDILKIAPLQLLEDARSDLEADPNYKVIANLPYYITSPTLRHFLEAELRPSRMVVMVQREVGEAIAAAPGKMSLLSVRVQFFCKPAIVCYVPAASFNPPPKVESVVLRLDVYTAPPIDVSDVAGFFDIVTHGFSLPRKQLRNSLAHSLRLPPGQVVSLLEKAGIESKRRAETLSLEEWRELWKVFAPFAQGSAC